MTRQISGLTKSPSITIRTTGTIRTTRLLTTTKTKTRRREAFGRVILRMFDFSRSAYKIVLGSADNRDTVMTITNRSLLSRRTFLASAGALAASGTLHPAFAEE